MFQKTKIKEKRSRKKTGKKLDLDDEAVAILSKIYPLPEPINVVHGVPHEQYEQLQNVLISQQQENSMLKDKLMQANEFIAVAKGNQLLLDERTKRVEELQDESKVKSEQLQNAQLEIEKLKSELAEAKKEAESYQKTWFGFFRRK